MWRASAQRTASMRRPRHDRWWISVLRRRLVVVSRRMVKVCRREEKLIKFSNFHRHCPNSPWGVNEVSANQNDSRSVNVLDMNKMDHVKSRTRCALGESRYLPTIFTVIPVPCTVRREEVEQPNHKSGETKRRQNRQPNFESEHRHEFE